jgi:radical SAM-linked protein
MRVIVKYTREERVKYISHLDLMRTMQRAVRRADIPIAYSQGFNPHPIMSFASALPVGVTSDGEYIDMLLSDSMSLPVLKERLNHALPKGITVRDAMAVDRKAPSLMSLIERADYKVTLNGIDWKKALAAYRNAPEIWVEKRGKRGVTTVNLKESVYAIGVDQENQEVLHISMKIGKKGSLKPDSVVEALLELSDQNFIGSEQEDTQGPSTAIHRIGLYYRRNGEWVTPLLEKKD